MLFFFLAHLCRVRVREAPSALFNPKTSIFIQKRHPYIGNPNRETSGDSKIVTWVLLTTAGVGRPVAADVEHEAACS